MLSSSCAIVLWIHRLCAASLVVVAGIFPLVPASAVEAANARQIASLNVCADQMMMALAPERIRSLSPLSRDPAISYLSAQSLKFPANLGRGEALILDKPDLVLIGPYDGRARKDLLAEHGVPTLMMLPWASLDNGRHQLKEFAEKLGVEKRAAKLQAEIDAALQQNAGIAPKRTVLPLQRRGYTPGEASIIAELLRHMGLVPYQQALGLPVGGFVRLEQLIAQPPDYLLLSSNAQSAFDHGTAFLIHPALQKIIPDERRLVLTGPLLTCDGPSTPAAIHSLAGEVRAKVR